MFTKLMEQFGSDNVKLFQGNALNFHSTTQTTLKLCIFLEFQFYRNEFEANNFQCTYSQNKFQ